MPKESIQMETLFSCTGGRWVKLHKYNAQEKCASDFAIRNSVKKG